VFDALSPAVAIGGEELRTVGVHTIIRIGTTDYNVLMNSSPPVVEEFNRMPLKVVNGVPVIRNGAVTGAKPGQILRRTTTASPPRTLRPVALR